MEMVKKTSDAKYAVQVFFYDLLKFYYSKLLYTLRSLKTVRVYLNSRTRRHYRSFNEKDRRCILKHNAKELRIRLSRFVFFCLVV